MLWNIGISFISFIHSLTWPLLTEELGKEAHLNVVSPKTVKFRKVCTFNECQVNILNRTDRTLVMTSWFINNLKDLRFEHKAFKGNVKFVQNTSLGLWEKMIAQLQKTFCKIPMNTRANISS